MVFVQLVKPVLFWRIPHGRKAAEQHVCPRRLEAPGLLRAGWTLGSSPDYLSVRAPIFGVAVVVPVGVFWGIWKLSL